MKSDQSTWRGKLRYYMFHVLLGADDSAHNIALGFAIGMFVAFTPTIPFQMLLTILFCFIFRANKAVGIPVVWITNPATIIPIYLPLYMLGCSVLGIDSQDIEWNVLLDSSGTTLDYAERTWELMEGIFWPLWVGCLIGASVLAVGSYGLVKYAVVRYRQVKSDLKNH